MRTLALLALALALSACDSGASEFPVLGHCTVTMTGRHEVSFEGNATYRVEPLAGGSGGYRFSLFLWKRPPDLAYSIWILADRELDEPLPPGTYEGVRPAPDSLPCNEPRLHIVSTAAGEPLHPERGLLRIEAREDGLFAGTLSVTDSSLYAGEGWVETHIESAFEAVRVDRP